MTLSAATRARLAQLGAQYRASLPQKLSAIQLEYAAVQRNPGGVARLSTLRRLAHNLAGSAAMHGLTELAARARDIDRLISVAGGGIEAPPGAELAEAMDGLRRAFDDIADTDPPDA